MVPEDLEPRVWLVNRQEEMLIQIKADAATQHAQATRNRDVDQPAENRLAMLNASIRKRMHDQDQIFLQLKYRSD